MTIKATALNVIQSLPAKATMDDMMHALYVNTKFCNGENEILAEKGIEHGVVNKRLKKWIK